jgi:hypothetical protein
MCLTHQTSSAQPPSFVEDRLRKVEGSDEANTFEGSFCATLYRVCVFLSLREVHYWYSYTRIKYSVLRAIVTIVYTCTCSELSTFVP